MEPKASLPTVLREWGRIGCIGFGGPPTHISLFRKLCVDDRDWLTADDFADAVTACNLLPGPSSTQLAIYCADRVRGRVGALVGGAAFIVPGLVMILALAAVFLAGSPPLAVTGAGAGASAAVAAVAIHAGWGLIPASWHRALAHSRVRWLGYFTIGAMSAAALGPWLVVVLLVSGGIEVLARRVGRTDTSSFAVAPLTMLGATITTGGLSSLAWVALKVGAFSYGGGFVIIPLMESDAVHQYHWMTSGQFLNAVALGQVTPGPLVQTVAVVGYAAAGVGGGLLAAAVAFAPSFVFILVGARHLDRLRSNEFARAFLDGAGPAALGAIVGSAIPLAASLAEPWQFVVLAGAALLLLLFRRSVLQTLLAAAGVGAALVLAGVQAPH